jgi:deazaflavin-dependent oxidoreductase (nitroreductase family)
MVQENRGVRTGIRDAVRGFNKRLLNPVMLRLAGRRHWYAARLEHVGRRSGRSYATPVVASPVPGGFVVPLPYGQDVDWLRNVQAAQGGILVVQGRRYAFTEPEVLRTSQIYPDLPHQDQLRSRVWRIGHWLRVKAAPEGPVEGQGPAEGQSL